MYLKGIYMFACRSSSRENNDLLQFSSFSRYWCTDIVNCFPGHLLEDIQEMRIRVFLQTCPLVVYMLIPRYCELFPWSPTGRYTGNEDKRFSSYLSTCGLHADTQILWIVSLSSRRSRYNGYLKMRLFWILCILPKMPRQRLAAICSSHQIWLTSTGCW